MKILVLGSYYWPEQFGIAPFNTGRCEYLAARGHDVTVCTGFPNYPEWRIADGYRGQFMATEERNGVKILRSWLYVPRRVSSIKRIVHEASIIATSLMRALSQRKPDLLLVVSPPLGMCAAGAVLSKRWGIPYVFHVADLQPDAAVDLGMLNQPRLIRFLYSLERFAYRNAVLVSTLTRAMRERIVAKGIPSEKVVLFRDWIEPSLFDIPLRGGGTGFRREFGVEERFLVVHAGNMGVKQGLEVVLDAAERSRSADGLLYMLVGDGAAQPGLRARAAAANIPNVQFLPPQPKRMFDELLGAADVSLITQQRVVGDVVFPSKTMTLLAAGRPIIASLSPGSEVARVISEAKAGVAVEPENPHALVEAVLALRENHDARYAMGENGRRYARAHWERETTLCSMEECMLQLAQRNIRVRNGFSQA